MEEEASLPHPDRAALRKRNNSKKDTKKPKGSGFGRRFYWKFWERKNQDVNDIINDNDNEVDESTIERELVDIDHARARKFTYNALSEATKNFCSHTIVGRGGFGHVYKGLLKDDNMRVAIKKMNKATSQGKGEFISEIKVLVNLRHENIVGIVGWCHERGELMLVYEFMPNGNLGSHLYPTKSDKRVLDWKTRYRIILGLASAILHLHEEWRMCVLHRDLKPGNIMLDSEMNPRVTDFGLARLMDHGSQQLVTRVAGTLGYMAPEYTNSGMFGKKSDVYSFGIIVLEVAFGKKPFNTNEGADLGEERTLVERVWERYENGAVLDYADERLRGFFDKSQMLRVIEVGLWCTLPGMESRPLITEAKKALNFEGSLPDLALLRPTHKYPETPHLVMPSYSASNTSIYTHVSTHYYNQTRPFVQRAASGKIGTSKALNATTVGHSDATVEVPNHEPPVCDSDDARVQNTRRGTSARSPSDKVANEEPKRNDESDSGSVNQPGSNFDIGIPHRYKSTVSQPASVLTPIIIGLAKSIEEMLKKETQFSCVMEWIRKSTSFLVTLGAPLDEWNSLAQFVLRSIKDIEDMKFRIEVGQKDVDLNLKLLSKLDKEMDECTATINVDNEELTNSRQKLISAQHLLVSLTDELATLKRQQWALKKRIKETEKISLSTQETINVIETRSAQNSEKLESLRTRAALTSETLQVRKGEVQGLEESMSSLRMLISSKLSLVGCHTT